MVKLVDTSQWWTKPQVFDDNMAVGCHPLGQIIV